MLSAILDANLPKKQEKETIAAMTKLIWLQNDFFAKYYVREAEPGGDEAEEQWEKYKRRGGKRVSSGPSRRQT